MQCLTFFTVPSSSVTSSSRVDAGSRVVDRDVFRLGIGLGPRVHHDRFPSVQAFQPLTAQAQSVHLARKAGLKVGLAWDGAASWRGSSDRFGPRC